jgi:hypothetical protein
MNELSLLQRLLGNAALTQKALALDQLLSVDVTIAKGWNLNSLSRPPR